MPQPKHKWQIPSPVQVPQWFRQAVKEYNCITEGNYLAQVLWQRGLQDVGKLSGFLNPHSYIPTSPFAFGQEMKRAVYRLLKAREMKETVTIWGDFDADGITSTSVLWEGLGQFFVQNQQLNYYIPNRLKESHGLNISGIEKLTASGTKVIITCDTGSTNLKEIDYANCLGIDVIITDHHTLPEDRPPVLSIINPRYFAETHPLYHLSGVAVAYKLVEALYLTLPNIPQQPLEKLLDLVAIGLIADLVQLSGDCRYLAQLGIQQIQEQQKNPTRPGIFHLLSLCKRTGDRPTDISFGLGPRINAISRIQGDASFGVELLTSSDLRRTKQLAEETELANTRRKSLQKKIQEEVKEKLSRMDLSTTSVIVLEDSQWEVGVLGLVASQIVQEYGRPTILLSSISEGLIARGSARSLFNIDLYELIKSQEHLLEGFGGHPLAAGLSLLVENIPLFREGIERRLREKIDVNLITPVIEVDLIVTVAELGKDLFRELKWLEPCGMGNPVPKLLIKNCWFEGVRNFNSKDLLGKKVQYIKTIFTIWDDSVSNGFPGVWWGHYQEELPHTKYCDAIVELDYNAYGQGRYEVRLIAVKASNIDSQASSRVFQPDSIIDWRGENLLTRERIEYSDLRILYKCPLNWDEMQKEYLKAISNQQKLALAYCLPQSLSSEQVWQHLIGIAKYLSRTGQSVTKNQIQEKLELSDRTFNLGVQALESLGFNYEIIEEYISFIWFSQDISLQLESGISLFLSAVEEEQFQRQYFSYVSLSTLQTILEQQLFLPIDS